MGMEYPRYLKKDSTGNLEMLIPTGGDLEVFDGTTLLYQVRDLAGTTQWRGRTGASTNLYIHANSSDSRASFQLFGAGGCIYDIESGSKWSIKDNGTWMMSLYLSGTNDTIQSRTANNDLYLQTNGTGVVKFGTYAAITTEVNAGFITVKDAAGNTRKLCVVA